MPRRRDNLYRCLNDLLDHLSDIYKKPLLTTERINRNALRSVRQNNRPFLEFYSDFMKYFQGRGSGDDEELIIWDLTDKVDDGLQKAIQIIGRKWSMPELRDFLITLDYQKRYNREKAR